MGSGPLRSQNISFCARGYYLGAGPSTDRVSGLRRYRINHGFFRKRHETGGDTRGFAIEPADMRLGIDGLCAKVQHFLSQNPYGGEWCPRRRIRYREDVATVALSSRHCDTMMRIDLS